jgi:hypothetical protein
MADDTVMKVSLRVWFLRMVSNLKCFGRVLRPPTTPPTTIENLLDSLVNGSEDLCKLLRILPRISATFHTCILE